MSEEDNTVLSVSSLSSESCTKDSSTKVKHKRDKRGELKSFSVPFNSEKGQQKQKNTEKTKTRRKIIKLDVFQLKKAENWNEGGPIHNPQK
jgi:hypothetical protein